MQFDVYLKRYNNKHLQFTLLPGPIRIQEILKCKNDLFHILVHNR